MPERREPALDLLARHAQFRRAHRHRRGIVLVVFAGHRQLNNQPRPPSEKPHPALRASNHLAHVGILAVGDDHSAPWHDGHQLAERALHRRQIGKNVGVVKLDIIQDHRVGQVVDELAALVEKRRVVFVALNNETLPLPYPRPAAEIVGYAANQKPRRQTCRLHHPRQQRGRRRLAVRAGNHHGMFAAQKTVPHQFRQRTHPQPLVERALHLGIARASSRCQ